MKSIRLAVLLFVLGHAASAIGSEPLKIEVQAGDVDGLIQAIVSANVHDGSTQITIVPGPNGETEFVFSEPADGYTSALPDVTGRVSMDASGITFRADPPQHFRFLKVIESGEVALTGATVRSFGAPSGANRYGGAVLVQDMGSFVAQYDRFVHNLASENGGAIAVRGNGRILTADSLFAENWASNRGGSISFEDNTYGYMWRTHFRSNASSGGGCDVYLDSTGFIPPSQSFDYGSTLLIHDSTFSGDCEDALIRGRNGVIEAEGNSFASGEGPGIIFTGSVEWFSNLFTGNATQQQPQSSTSDPKPEANCEGAGGSTTHSLGYNISADNSCGLNQPTDRPNTDPRVALNEAGVPVPLPGSPAIDGGAIDSMVIGDGELASLPCGYVDLLGTARPQDGNGDGVFECDVGAVEIAGAGDVTDGHSGAFFNLDRDGEGTYVEILSDTTAVVYTFTYRPDGSGPAWFIGVGWINGNSIIVDELLRPVGTSFGNGFDAADIEFTPIGGMSMVFPNCAAANPGGNVAYSGDFALGYEGLITRATRLSNITGCGGETPNPKAGLSGSYFDPARDGEGIIVEWLTSGQVLVVFFTYDQNGNQLWLIGIGEPNGNTVTMDALYASTYTRWGSGFDPGEVTISNWGSFTLTWSQCNAVSFHYNSAVPGYGSATRNYTRLSKLQNTDCPAF